MSSISSDGSVAIVETGYVSSLDCTVFKNRLDAVLKIIDNGAIGRALGGSGYASDEHLAALVNVEQQLAATRAHIAEMRARDAKNLPALDSEDPDLVYSVDGEDFSRDNLCDVIDALRSDTADDAELIGRTYFVGIRQQQSASHYFAGQVDHLIDMARDLAHQDCPEHTEDFAQDVPAEALKELDDLIKAWADRYVNVSFWTVEGVEKQQLTEDDL